MILVCGGLADPVTELFCARLEDLGFQYRLLNLGVYPNCYKVNWNQSERLVSGEISGPDWSLQLETVTGVFVRYVDAGGHMTFNGLSPARGEAVLAECQAGLSTILDDLPCLVANRTVEGAFTNHSKPYQALLIRKSGLLTPPTLITSDPVAAQTFIEAWSGDVIFKSLSGVRSIVRRIGASDLERLHLISSSITQFQAFIPGDNIRVHVVGGRILATRIRTEAVDYRYARQQGSTAHLEAVTLPAQVASSCRQLARSLGLILAGIDLKETPTGDWYCFEVNPSPAFSFYELQTHQPISTVLAETLRNG
jgi:hypothetical protein